MEMSLFQDEMHTRVNNAEGDYAIDPTGLVLNPVNPSSNDPYLSAPAPVINSSPSFWSTLGTSFGSGLSAAVPGIIKTASQQVLPQQPVRYTSLPVAKPATSNTIIWVALAAILLAVVVIVVIKRK